MMSFLHWIYETYLARKWKKGKRKSVNQYWRDFKMLYRCVDGATFQKRASLTTVLKYKGNNPKIQIWNLRFEMFLFSDLRDTNILFLDSHNAFAQRLRF
ncbi:hypothetical protein B0O99DRAFT_158586 [Bisporella sp. PMI_857]|nr:hypothetical protein B0O99DRAFT_158586 [Bisporella sp. PMI_857]